MSDLAKAALTAVVCTLFLDLLDLAFGRAVSIIWTLRFFLYYTLHLIVSLLACVLLYPAVSQLHFAVPQWLLLGLAGSFLGVGVVSNSDVKIAGADLAPLGTIFREIKAKMVVQAADDKSDRIEIAELTGRLRNLTPAKLRGHCGDALTGSKWKNDKIQVVLQEATRSGDESRALAELMLRHNLGFVRKKIGDWEKSD